MQPAEDAAPLARRTSMALFWNTFFFPVKTVIAIAVSIIVVRWLNIGGYALLALATSVLSTIGLYSDLGIERSLSKFIPEIELTYGRRGVKRFVLGVAGLKLGLLVLLVAALNLFEGYFSDLFRFGEEGWLLIPIISALLILGCISDITIQVLFSYFKQKITNLLDILAAVVNPFFTVLFVLLGWGAVGVLLALLITTVLSVIVSTVQAVRAARQAADRGREFGRADAQGLARRVFSYSGLVYFLNISVYFYDLPFVVFVLTFYRDLAAVALITLSYKFAKQFLRALVVPLTGVQTPLFARTYAEGRREAMKTAYNVLTKFLTFTLVPAGVGLAIMSGDLLQLLYMKDQPGAVLSQDTLATAVLACIILIALLFGESLISVALGVLLVYERNLAVIFSRLVALMAVPLLFVLVPALGIVGAALAMGLAPLLSRFVSLAFAWRELDLSFPLGFLVRVAGSTAAFAVVLVPLVWVLPTTYLTALALILLAVLIFYVSFKLQGGFDSSDKERVLAIGVPFGKAVVRFL